MSDIPQDDSISLDIAIGSETSLEIKERSDDVMQRTATVVRAVSENKVYEEGQYTNFIIGFLVLIIVIILIMVILI